MYITWYSLKVMLFSHLACVLLGGADSTPFGILSIAQKRRHLLTWKFYYSIQVQLTSSIKYLKKCIAFWGKYQFGGVLSRHFVKKDKCSKVPTIYSFEVKSKLKNAKRCKFWTLLQIGLLKISFFIFAQTFNFSRIGTT